MQGLKSDPKRGIIGTKEDLANRAEVYGNNFFPPPRIKGLLELVLENFEDPINQILLAAALVSLVIGIL